ncbi:MAG: hypothetical protein OEM51_01750 [Gammaproteobacteria bacterium]|nr:hypothetical protein [Gammaproteobacteria bacterium]
MKLTCLSNAEKVLLIRALDTREMRNLERATIVSQHGNIDALLDEAEAMKQLRRKIDESMDID